MTLLVLLVLLVLGCQAEEPPRTDPTGRNLAEAQWALTDRENREKLCGIYRTQGRKGLAQEMKTRDEEFLDDFTDMMERLCPPLALKP